MAINLFNNLTLTENKMETQPTINAENENSESSKKQRLLSDETYQSLMNTQDALFEKTGIRIPLRKIIDRLINAESMQKITNELIEKLNFLAI